MISSHFGGDELRNPYRSARPTRNRDRERLTISNCMWVAKCYGPCHCELYEYDMLLGSNGRRSSHAVAAQKRSYVKRGVGDNAEKRAHDAINDQRPGSLHGTASEEWPLWRALLLNPVSVGRGCSKSSKVVSNLCSRTLNNIKHSRKAENIGFDAPICFFGPGIVVSCSPSGGGPGWLKRSGGPPLRKPREWR